MKKYITPNIECNSFEGAMLMYTPSDGHGSEQTTNPVISGGGTPNNARVF